MIENFTEILVEYTMSIFRVEQQTKRTKNWKIYRKLKALKITRFINMAEKTSVLITNSFYEIFNFHTQIQDRSDPMYAQSTWFVHDEHYRQLKFPSARPDSNGDAIGLHPVDTRHESWPQQKLSSLLISTFSSVYDVKCLRLKLPLLCRTLGCI
jgi:hypothetical protein